MEPAVSPHSHEETKRFAFFLRGTLRLSAESVDNPGEYVRLTERGCVMGLTAEQRIEAAIELLDLRCDSLPRLAHREVTECVVKLRTALDIAAKNLRLDQCRGGRRCTCCSSGCDCGCRNDCPQWKSQDIGRGVLR